MDRCREERGGTVTYRGCRTNSRKIKFGGEERGLRMRFPKRVAAELNRLELDCHEKERRILTQEEEFRRGLRMLKAEGKKEEWHEESSGNANA